MKQGLALLIFLLLVVVGVGCVAPSTQPASVSPRPAPAASTPAGTNEGSQLGASEVDGGSIIVGTWEVVAVAGTTCELAASDATPTAGHVGIACAADTPVGARVLKTSDGTCSLIHPRPDCGPGRICDPRPAQEVTCPGAP